MDSSAFRIPDPGFRIPDPRFPIPDSRFRIPDFGFPIPDSGFRIPDSGFRIPDSGFRIPDYRFRISDSGFRLPGAFSIYKNFWKISIGNFRLEERVPFATSSIQGSRGTPGRLKDRERSGTGDKNNTDEKHKFSNGKFPPGKRDYLLSSSTFSGNFPVGRTEKTLFI